jgi:CubicO group peptidase (beta-lactamase class C family)
MMDEGIHEGITGLVTSSITSGLFPGAVWRVERGGDSLSEGFAGHAEKVPGKREMTARTMFDLASLTKPVCTGTLLLRMRQEGLMSLDQPVASYLPEFSGGRRDQVRVSQVMSHSSGLPSGLGLKELCASPAEVLDRICGAEMAYPPGTGTLYSDVGFILLGILLERISGEPLDQLLQTEVLGPLGLGRTMFRPGPGLRGEIAATQDSPSRGRVLVGEVHDGNAHFMGGVSGHAGLFSCMHDLTKYCRMLLGTGNGFLSREAIDDATRIWSDDGENAYGLSWFKRKSPLDLASGFGSKRAYYHTGYTGTSILIDPGLELFAILLTNRVHPDRNAERIPEMSLTRRRFHELALGH